MKNILTLFASALLFLSISAGAQETISVQGMQLPVWHVSNGDKKALRLDSEIRAGDEIITGEGGRLLALTPDGSDLKLGSGARFIVHELAIVDSAEEINEPDNLTDAEKLDLGDVSRAEAAPLRASLEIRKGVYEIPEGAFRFATRLALKYLNRDISVKVGFSTVGIRGTDFWGKSDSVLDTVCLIEGAIAIDKDGELLVELDQPLTFYRSEKGGQTQPVAPVDLVQLTEWAGLVDLRLREGVLTPEGNWSVYLGAFRAQEGADAMRDQLDLDGYPASIVESDVDGVLYRVVINHFDTYSDANTFIEIADNRFGIEGAWLSQVIE